MAPITGLGLRRQYVVMIDEKSARADQILKRAAVLGHRFPETGLFAGAEVGDQAGVDLVVLGADQAAAGVMMDAARVDDADLVLVKKQGQRFAVAAADPSVPIRG